MLCTTEASYFKDDGTKYEIDQYIPSIILKISHKSHHDVIYKLVLLQLLIINDQDTKRKLVGRLFHYSYNLTLNQ